MPKIIKLSLFILSLAVAYFILPESMPEAAKRVFLIFVFAAVFWAFEIIPLFATSILVVVLQMFALAHPGGVLGMDKSGFKVFLDPFADPVIMLFLGGFALAVAVSKYQIDNVLAVRMMRLFGKRPYFVLLGFVLTTGFISMWMSNTATAALMLVMVRPLIGQLKEGDLFRKALVLAIPFGANIGGIATPVGTPPNAIAMGVLSRHDIHISFIEWMGFAFPLAVILLVFVSGVLFFLFPTKEKELNFHLNSHSPISGHAKGVGAIMLLTIVLWLTSEFHKIPESMVALLAVALLAGFKFLEAEDVKKIEWDVLILMWGGLALGEGMERSGLTEWFVSQPLFEHQGFLLVLILCLVTMVLTAFLSNTVTANLMLPLAMNIPGENPLVLVIMIALSCSFSMALPIATPPNTMAFATRMIKSKDMIKSGILIDIASLSLLLLGFQWIIPRVLDIF